jgi:hypothetical protein
VIFAVVDVQENGTALSRLAEYFVEMEQLEPSHALSLELEKSFGTDLSALAARAQVAIALRDGPAAGAAIEGILPALARGDDLELAWDRRVSLVFVLVQAKRPDLARQQVQRCVEEIDEARLRSLSAAALINLAAAASFSAWRSRMPNSSRSRANFFPRRSAQNCEPIPVTGNPRWIAPADLKHA